MIIFPGVIGAIATKKTAAITPLILGNPNPSFISLSSGLLSSQSTLTVTGTATETLSVVSGDPFNFSVSSSPTNGSSLTGGATITVTVTYVGSPFSSTSTSINVSLSGGSNKIISVNYIGGMGP